MPRFRYEDNPEYAPGELDIDGNMGCEYLHRVDDYLQVLKQSQENAILA
jgi:hypothetical protein